MINKYNIWRGLDGVVLNYTKNDVTWTMDNRKWFEVTIPDAILPKLTNDLTIHCYKNTVKPYNNFYLGLTCFIFGLVAGFFAGTL